MHIVVRCLIIPVSSKLSLCLNLGRKIFLACGLLLQ
jgi:hypothetical protein